MAISVKRLFLILSMGLGLGACHWQGRTGPNILVIAVEHLSFERVSCESDELTGREFESFRLFCEDGVRFTHAYTTSTMSQAALSSLLTGLYPLEHGVRHNGADYLSARFETVPEVASQNGLRTALFSGGPPILRKSGLSQGFEVFDDHFATRAQGFYRSSQEVVKVFINWLKKSVLPGNFFAVLYFADLQFPQATTISDMGEVRERSQESQVREVAESLTGLIKSMRDQGLWHRTHVILVGLNGGGSNRPGEVGPLNLYGEGTQVALYLKPARRTVDQGPQWTIDKNVSLADVGKSLYEFVGGPVPSAETAIAKLPRISFYPLIRQAQADWSDDRLILVESAWGNWRGLSPIRYAARRRQYFYIHDERPKIYNTLLDRFETNPLPLHDPLWTALDESVLGFFKQMQLSAWKPTDIELWHSYMKAQKWWAQKEIVQTVASKRQNLIDRQLGRWYADFLVQKNDWSTLLKLGEVQKELLYSYVAHRNLGQAGRPPAGMCSRLFSSNYLRQYNHLTRAELNCGDIMFEHLIDVVTSPDQERRERAMEAFVQDYNLAATSSEVGSANYSRFLPWDVAIYLPSGIRLWKLFLALPENKKLHEEVKSRRSREDRALDL